jgi:hypothetical protein
MNDMPPVSKFPANVIRFPSQNRKVTEFDRLTFALVMKRLREGTLEPGVVEFMLLGIGIQP